MNAATFLKGDIAYAFSWTMIHSFWQCTLIAVLLGISLSINRHQSARLRYLQGIVALLVCVAVSVATYIHLHNSIVQAKDLIRIGGPTIHYFGSIWEQTYTLFNHNIHYILIVWFVGFIIQFGRYSLDFIQALRLRNQDSEPVNNQWAKRCQALARRVNVSKKIVLKNSSRVSSICVIGHFKPIILLPIGLLASLDVDQVEALLLHELAHIKRNDYLVNAIQCFVRLLYFFNPAVLWISNRIDIERENACDDIAVKHCGGAKLYAQSLANISLLNFHITTVLAAKKNKYQMLPRVTRLFANSSGIAKSVEQLVSGLFALGLIAAMNASATEFNLPVPANSRFIAQNTIAIQADQPAPNMTTPAISDAIEVEPANTVVASMPETQSTLPTIELANPALDFALKNSSTKPIQLAQATAQTPNTADAQKPKELLLAPMDTPDFDQFLLASDFTLPVSRTIYISDIEVVFADIWNKRFLGLTSKDYRQTIKKKYSATFSQAIKKALINTGWTVVPTPNKDSLILTPKVFDLYIFAPETPGSKVSIISLAGQAATEITIATPKSQAFIKIVDYRNTANASTGPAQANRATNFYYFKRLFSDWAKTTVEYLENVMIIVERQQSSTTKD